MRDICFNRLSVHQSVRYVGIGVAFEHCLCTFCGDFEEKICPNRGFVNPRKAYFITFELFSSPKGRESDKKKEAKKFKCGTYARER